MLWIVISNLLTGTHKKETQKGCPDVPAGQVFQQERQKYHCFKLIVSIGEEVYGQHQGRGDVDGGQDKVDESKGNSFFDILTSVWCVLCQEEFHFIFKNHMKVFDPTNIYFYSDSVGRYLSTTIISNSIINYGVCTMYQQRTFNLEAGEKIDWLTNNPESFRNPYTG